MSREGITEPNDEVQIKHLREAIKQLKIKIKLRGGPSEVVLPNTGETALIEFRIQLRKLLGSTDAADQMIREIDEELSAKDSLK